MVRVARKAGSEREVVHPPPVSGTRDLRNAGCQGRTLTWL